MSFIYNQLAIYHKVFKWENKKLVLNIDNMDYSSINQYSPINIPGLINALTPYINIHDMLKLLMLCKSFRLTLKQETIIFEQGNFIENAAASILQIELIKLFNNIISIDHFHLTI